MTGTAPIDMALIVLALDGDEERSDQQVQTIIDLFADRESDTDDPVQRVDLLYVFTDNPEGASVRNIGAVTHAHDALADAGIDVSLHERSGDPADEIVAFADEHDADAICVAGRKRSPTGKALFGSVTQSVILTSDRPVLLAGRSSV